MAESIRRKRQNAAKEDKKREKAAPEDWEMEYSYEEKMLKAYLDPDRQGYVNWEKKNRSWELQNGFTTHREEEERKQKEVRVLLSLLSLKDPKKEKEAFHKRLLELHTKRVPSREEELQKREGRREELATQGRCLDGNYLTPYCKCDRQCYRFDTTLKDHPQECLPIWLAYCRQYRQSHCFDIDDCIDGVCPLGPSHGFGGMSEIMTELASRAIKEYNEKECNVFKYKVLKIEKVNYTVGMYNTYWMTVRVLNLTLGHSWFAKLRVLFWPAVRVCRRRLGIVPLTCSCLFILIVTSDPSFDGAIHDKHTSRTVAENIVDEVNVLDNANVTSTCMPILPCTRLVIVATDKLPGATD
ncbi:putative GPI ethanolamine phosphate transferase 2-like [Capsicum annuum]|nr:putative GPI ethanolamine phosphate transferase 2-like [Capsicum annuum]